MSARAKGLLATTAVCALLAGGAMLPHLATADPSEVTQASVDVTVPSGAVELRDNDFSVRLHPDFPQVVDYRIGQLQLAGRLGGALTSVLVDEQVQPVSVAAAVVSDDEASATYAITFPNLAGVGLDVVASVADDTLTMTLTNLVDPGGVVHRIAIPDLDLVTVGSADAGAQLTAGSLGSGDAFEDLATTPAGGAQGSWLVLANDSALAAAFESNASSDVSNDADERWQRRIREGAEATYGSVSPGTWTWLGESAGDLGRDPDPYLRVRITPDANGDGTVDWQDAAIAAQGIVDHGNGADDVRYEVLTRVVPNRATLGDEQFLHTLYDTKIMSLATDNLAQRVLLEGHLDGGPGDGAIGSSPELHQLADETESWNAVIGFGVELDETAPAAALERLAELRAAAPDNADWLQIGPTGHTGWAGQRLGEELRSQGWVVSSGSSDAFATVNTGELGGQGIESQVIRFVHNATRDGWADHPILASATAEAGADRDAILDDVWQRNLTAKFLQESDIVDWEPNAITFANGAVAQGSGSSRTVSYDGALVLDGDAYLLPWYDGGTSWNDTGQERLYHYNTDGGTTEWTLTQTWAEQGTLKLYALTDGGREFVRDLTPSNGRVTIEAEAGVAYVLYSTEALPEQVDPGPAPTPEPSPDPTPTPDPTASPTLSPTPDPTGSPTPTRTPPAPSATPTSTPTKPVLQYPEKLYQVPGLHQYNGRHWYTRCEPYSHTFRCWTSIWSTQVTREGSAYVQNTGWHFNNLTYLPSARALWTENNLGHTATWTASDGRHWYTECDTASTGRNGCRSYVRATYVRASANPAGGWTYASETGWVFNNIVLFG